MWREYAGSGCSSTQEDVQKYGTAGTIAYVLTELLFWAIALPNEVFLFYKTAGRWPDFDIDADKAGCIATVPAQIIKYSSHYDPNIFP
eukprot:6450050-Amphidinium_carterae.1